MRAEYSPLGSKASSLGRELGTRHSEVVLCVGSARAFAISLYCICEYYSKKSHYLRARSYRGL